MSRTKLGRMAIELNEDFREKLASAMLEKFEIEVTSFFALLGTGRLVTSRMDEEDFTPEELAWLAAYSDGYGEAMTMVRAADQR